MDDGNASNTDCLVDRLSAKCRDALLSVAILSPDDFLEYIHAWVETEAKYPYRIFVHLLGARIEVAGHDNLAVDKLLREQLADIANELGDDDLGERIPWPEPGILFPRPQQDMWPLDICEELLFASK